MAEFTPGPWQQWASFVYAPGEHGANICAISEPRDKRDVGYTPVRFGSNDREEAYANALLIAASPALFAACEDMIAALATSGSPLYESEATGKMRAALALARGHKGE